VFRECNSDNSRDYHNDDALFAFRQLKNALHSDFVPRLRDYGVTGAYLIGSVTAASPKPFCRN